MREMDVCSSLMAKPKSLDPMPRTILCVDDSPDMLEICRTVLEANGYHVLTACSGLEALELLRDHAVDAAVVDTVMPEMNGIALAREIKMAFPAVLVVMFSGSLRGDERDRKSTRLNSSHIPL